MVDDMTADPYAGQACDVYPIGLDDVTERSQASSKDALVVAEDIRESLLFTRNSSNKG